MNDDIAKHLGLAPLRDVVDAEIIESKPKKTRDSTRNF